MRLLSIPAFVLLALALGRRRRLSLLETAPWLLCVLGLVCYVLAFFGRMGWIDGLLLAGGLAAAWDLFRSRGPALKKTLRRELADPYLWTCLALLAVMIFCLRGEQILEWDGYGFWGPDTKSLYAREGFAPRYSNAAFRFGNYTPFAQIIWWWFAHLGGSYQERYLFWGYYIFCALLLFALGAQFRRRRPGNSPVGAVVIPLCAVALPGVATTSWYWALVVDPMLAILFGTVLVHIGLRPGEGEGGFWKVRLVTYLAALVLTKSIGFLWGGLAVVFAFLWWRRERRDGPFLLASALTVLVSGGSWWLYCKAMDRSGYLSDSFAHRAGQRLAELRAGDFLATGNNGGYLVSYLKGFFLTPIHQEHSIAIDLSPFALLVLLFAGAVVLWRLGFIPRGKLRRLLLFMGACLVIIYASVTLGQLTMFYDETQYLDPVQAAKLMTRYCAPADLGLLMLLAGFASGNAPGASVPAGGDRRTRIVCLVTAAILLTCTAWNDIGRRFVYDPLDEQRIALRTEYETRFRPFADRVSALPLDAPGVRVLLVTRETAVNPIVVNQVSPVSMDWLMLWGDPAGDLERLKTQAAACHDTYLYLQEGDEAFRGVLAAETGVTPDLETLYPLSLDGAGRLTLSPAE